MTYSYDRTPETISKARLSRLENLWPHDDESANLKADPSEIIIKNAAEVRAVPGYWNKEFTRLTNAGLQRVVRSIPKPTRGV
jgi:hypothetical protein